MREALQILEGKYVLLSEETFLEPKGPTDHDQETVLFRALLR